MLCTYFNFPGESLQPSKFQHRQESPQPSRLQTLHYHSENGKDTNPDSHCIYCNVPGEFTVGPVTVRYVEAKIKKFQKRFNDLKKATRVCLAERRISVKLIVNSLALMLADENEEHRLFFRDHLTDLYQSPDPSELFGKLSFLHWDYLSYQLLDYLIKEFELKVDKAMETYKDDLRRFREKTPLALFCQTQKRRRRKPSEEFQ